MHISNAAINNLIMGNQHIKMFKHEDCPGRRKLSAIRNAPEAQGVRRVSILIGTGGLYVPQEVCRGADGIMTGFAFIGALVEAYELFAAGKMEAVEDLYDIYLPLIRHEQQIGFGLALRKETLRRFGAHICGASRVSGPAVDADNVAELEDLFARSRTELESIGKTVPNGI